MLSATIGTLFEHQEVCQTRDLEALVRQAKVVCSAQFCAFHDGTRGTVVSLRAIRSMRETELAAECQ
jgi:hypothetical protein